MKRRLVHDLLDFGGLSNDDIFYDLGCGDGRVLLTAVREFGVRSATGYDVAWLPFWLAQRRIGKSGLKNISVHRQNFMTGNYKGATFIYMYLFPKIVDRLARKFALELPSGAKVLSPSFPIDMAKHPEFSLLKTGKIGKITAYLYQKN
ncbi:MAG TPA: class I SAM-dependent methyltransferase [Candidatus Paceibacterota bacterium]|nr:class I SAM-dependent methyltransferase [Candidatus Paceibacterota bacterium]